MLCRELLVYLNWMRINSVPSCLNFDINLTYLVIDATTTVFAIIQVGEPPYTVGRYWVIATKPAVPNVFIIHLAIVPIGSGRSRGCISESWWTPASRTSVRVDFRITVLISRDV